MSLRPRFGASWFALVTLLAFAAYRPGTVSAGEGFQPISPEELKMASEPQAPGAPAIILYHQVDRDDNGLTSHEDNYLRIKILAEEGRKYADIEIPFFKGNGNVVGIKARTIRADGSIANFDGKVFEKSIAKAKGLKYLAKTFTLPDVQVGSIIEYSYTYDLSEHYIYDSHWILSDELFTKAAKFSLKPYRSNYSNVGVRWTWQGLPPGTVEPKQGGDHVVRLEAKNIPAFQTEDFMPPENELKSRVDFIYSDELFENDPDKFWKKTGKKLNDQLEGFVGKRTAMEQAVAQIVSADDPPETKLQKIYARVQQLRNTSYEVQKTEQEKKREKEKDANNVEDVWKRGYGNGVQLTWLYLALVRAAGFEAYGVWASDRRNYFFMSKMMDRTRLDANVVLVKVNGKEIYCDPGAAFTPFGLLTWPETGVQGLRLDKDGGTWVRTVLPESSASRIERRANIKLSDGGDIEGKLTITFTGLEAILRRMEERNEDEAERKKFLEDQVKEDIPAGSEVDLTKQPEWNSSEAPLTAEFNLRVPGWASAAGRRAMLPATLFSAREKHMFEHADRVWPIYFRFPYKATDDVNIQLPAGWLVESVPKEEDKDLKGTEYSLKVEKNNGMVHIQRALRSDLFMVPKDSYSVLRGFFQFVKSEDEQQVVMQPGGTTASN